MATRFSDEQKHIANFDLGRVAAIVICAATIIFLGSMLYMHPKETLVVTTVVAIIDGGAVWAIATIKKSGIIGRRY